MKVSLDIETYSECDLRACGVYKYAEDPSTEILVACYAFDDEPVQTYIPDKHGPVPARLREHIESGGIVSAFNAQFERVVLNGVAGEKVGWPKMSIEQMRCSMAKARVHGLPGRLGDAAEVMGTHAKQAGGKGVMLQLSKPRRGKESRYTPENSPEKFEQLYSYCVDDVEAERNLDRAVPDLTKRELAIWRLDQKINDRGVLVDLPAVADAQHLIAQYKKYLVDFCVKRTGVKPSQTAKLADWVRTNGYKQLKDLQAPTVKEALEDDACPKEIRDVLRCYSTHQMKAVSKYDAMKRAACCDGRLHGMFLFYGAGPGRWSSRIVQLQNLLRSLIKDADTAIAAMRERSLNWIRWLFHGIDPMKVIASCTRGMLIAAPDKDLMAFDFAQIESRIQAWLADCEWKLEFFRSPGEHKIYHVTGAMMFGCDPSEVVDEGEEQKYTAAKIGELACGYQGWAKAIEKFARQMGIKLSMPAEEIGSRWREANQEQVQLWYDLDEAAQWAVKNPGRAYGIPNKKILFKVEGRWLYMRLPSGRKLAYLDPELDENGGVTYMGVDTYTRLWKRVQTYGGKLLQNACEGIGRDLLVNGMLNMEKAGYKTVMTVHDEGVFEVPEGFGSEEEAMRLMTMPLKWAEGLPVVCDGFRAKRYKK